MLQVTFSNKVFFFFVFITFLFTQPTAAQNNIEWKDEKNKKMFHFVDAIEYHNETYTLKNRRSKVLIEKRAANLDLIKKINFKHKINEKKAHVWKFLNFNDKLYVISLRMISFSIKGNYELFINEFHTDDLTIGKIVFEGISSTTDPLLQEAKITFAISPDGSRLVLACIENDKKTIKSILPSMDVFVFNKNFNISYHHVSGIEIIDNYPEIRKMEIDEKGNIFIMTVEVGIKEKINYAQAEVIRINIRKEKEHRYTIKLKDDFVLRDANFTLLNDDIYIAGLYSEKKRRSKKITQPARGSFFIKTRKLKFSNTSLPTYQPFPAKVAKASLGPAAKKRAIKEIEYLRMKEIFPWNDNQIIVVAEVGELQDLSKKRNASPSFLITYKNIIISNYTLTGELSWVNTILNNKKKTIDYASPTIKKNISDSYFIHLQKEKLAFYYFVPKWNLISTTKSSYYKGKKLKTGTLLCTNFSIDGKKEISKIQSFKNSIPLLESSFFLSPHKRYYAFTYFLGKMKQGILYLE